MAARICGEGKRKVLVNKGDICKPISRWRGKSVNPAEITRQKKRETAIKDSGGVRRRYVT